MTGVTTRRPEEPCANSASTVLWELGAGNRPWLPDSEAAGGVVAPDPELVERPLRRRFSAEYKLRILAEAEAC